MTGQYRIAIHTPSKAQLPHQGSLTVVMLAFLWIIGCDNMPGLYPIASTPDHWTIKCLQIIIVTYLPGKGGSPIKNHSSPPSHCDSTTLLFYNLTSPLLFFLTMLP